ncbi:MAG: PEP-CTERM sorting domain-containing protein [Phycisphaerae bacterium]|nr:PEP-CTERM sorting domain-containing protein [Phycisphaerae bacterium]
MKKEVGILVLAAVLLCFVCLPVRADLITIAISGQVTGVSDQHNHFGGQIHVGDTITGTYIYDTAAYPGPSSGQYWHYSAPAGISLYVGDFNFKTDSTNVEFYLGIGNNGPFGEDIYVITSNHNLPLSNGTLVQFIDWILNDPTGTALSSDALPLTAPDLSSWSSNVLSISTDRDFSISAVVTSATLVPEPATLLLTVLGLILIRKHNNPLNK